MKTCKMTGAMLCAMLCALFAVSMGGCAADTARGGPSAPESDAPPLESQAAGDIMVSETERIPLENTDYKEAELENYKAIGAQFLCGDERFYRIAEAIYQYRDYHNALIFDADFTEITKTDPALLVEIAASQAPHIDIYGEAFERTASQNPVKAFFDRRAEQGLSTSLLSYGEDVRAKARELFGANYELPGRDGITILYDSELDLYYLDAKGVSIATDYPVIISELTQKAGDGRITVKVARLCYWDFNGQWSSPDGSWESGGLSAEQLREFLLERLGACDERFEPSVYTLQESGGVLRVTGFQKSV